MKLSELNNTLIPMRRMLGPKGHQVELSYRLNLGAMSLKQQIQISGLADSYKRAVDSPNVPSYVDSLHKQLAASLLPVLAEWDLEGDDDLPIPINADTLKTIPGPALLAMGLSVFELIQTDNPDLDDPEA